MQAVPNMLEIVPSGVNKRVGLDLLLEDLGLAREAVMALGDGGNDLHIVSHAGIGVAMGNAVPEVSQTLCSHCPLPSRDWSQSLQACNPCMRPLRKQLLLIGLLPVLCADPARLTNNSSRGTGRQRTRVL